MTGLPIYERAWDAFTEHLHHHDYHQPSTATPATEEGGVGGAHPESANGRASPPGSSVRAMKPPWCGSCDEITRQTGDPPRRCPDCHPLRTAQESA